MYGSASARTAGLSGGVHQLVPMFSSTYACVRSVKRIAASPRPTLRSHTISMLRCGHRRLQRGLVVQRGDAVATDRDAVVRDVDALGVDEGAARAELREHSTPVRILRRRASTARAGWHATPRAARRASSDERAPRHDQVHELRRALGVGRHLAGEVIADRGDRLDERVVGVAARSDGVPPAAPLARTSTVSFVLVHASTTSALNVPCDRALERRVQRRRARPRHRW